MRNDILNEQQRTYNEVFSKKSGNAPQCHQNDFHYDWWMFPTKLAAADRDKVSDRTRQYAVTEQDIQDLLSHPLFIKTYMKSIAKYLSNLEKYGWNNYPIRFAKLLCSIAEFIAVAKNSQDPAVKAIELQLELLACELYIYGTENIQTDLPHFAKGMAAVAKVLELEKASAELIVHQYKEKAPIAEGKKEKQGKNAKKPSGKPNKKF